MAHKADQRIPFLKMTGCGNDFIVIDNRSQIIVADQCQGFVRSACQRKLSVGADGVILIENDHEVDFKWRFFNADGSEAEMCGNGARCAARFAHLEGIVVKLHVAFRTLAGVITAEILGERVKIQTTLPQGLETHLSIENEGKMFPLHFINTGVPHVVGFLGDEKALEEFDVSRYGRSLRYHSRFQPAGTNVNFCYVRDEHFMRVRTYERGVEGETLACGTGAVASALIAAALDQVHSPVQVLTQGNEILTISFKQQGSGHFADVHLEGDAKVAYRGELWDETVHYGNGEK